ncbi:hypothetical protein H7169_00395 [Candidatus Gracilibacteria bacterium]|nr:hypothetical protein [Candidatus Gracilibacteria bacterium]
MITINGGASIETIMNSSELRKIFPMVYKNFFNTHDIVLSGDAVLTWGADISHGVSVLRIKQKLPLKTFIGANFNNSGKVTFGEIIQYSIVDNIFKRDSLNTFFKQYLKDIVFFIENFLSKNNISQGIDIDFLAEATPGHGFSSSAVISVLLTFLMHIITGKLDLQNSTNTGLILDKDLFDVIYKFSLDLSSTISPVKSIGGASNYAVMIADNPLPIVHFSQKCIHNGLYAQNIMNDENTDIHRCINHGFYKDSLLNFLGAENNDNLEFPLDYGIIFTGLEYRFSEIESMREKIKREESILNKFISTTIDHLPIDSTEKNQLAKLLEFDEDVTYKNIEHTNLMILEGFSSLFKNIYSDNGIDEFIETLQKVGLSSFSYQKENKLFFSLQHLFHQYQQFEDENISILPFNTGKIGGSLFFVMKKGKSRATITRVIEHLKNSGNIVSLDHASWRDGYGSDGVRMEQYISKKIFSEYTRAGDVLFVDSFGQSYSGDYDDMIKNETDCLLLDTIGGRVYLAGTKLTSKEIHSQNTTIDMLKLLLENIGKEIPNTMLPVSTYSQNKNEILSKIVLPIKKITKAAFGKELELTCSGGITEYYLKLDRDETVRLGIIRKLHN